MRSGPGVAITVEKAKRQKVAARLCAPKDLYEGLLETTELRVPGRYINLSLPVSSLEWGILEQRIREIC